VKEVKKKKKKMIILTDSNGCEVMEERIKCHMPQDDREEVEVEVVVAYTLFEVCQRL
jgi:thioredoxin-related protein